MAVRAKFVVTEVTRTMDGATVKLIPTTGGSPENEAFYKWTPSGSMILGTINLEAADQFIPGKAYYIDFTPAP